jgi:hypothetical protein
MSKNEEKGISTNKEEVTEEINVGNLKSKAKEKNIRRKEMLDKQMLVPIMNVTNGRLIYQSRKTGSEFRFERYGDIEYMELYELLTMRSGHRRFLDEPFIIVLDEEVAEFLGLSNSYKKLTHATEIDGIFDFQLEQFEDVIESIPKGLAHLVVSKAKEKIESKQLDSVQKVQAIEKVFNVKISK